MTTSWKVTLVWVMRRLPFVIWDRYIDDGLTMKIYGWISQPDISARDFIVVEYIKTIGHISFTTSDVDNSRRIARLLFGDAIGHSVPELIEIGFQEFGIENIVRSKQTS